jgi:hypothetical protein
VKYVNAMPELIIKQPRNMISLRLGLNLAIICPIITDVMPNIIELDENTDLSGELACAGGACEIK